ncbi:DUF7018 domain-containing (lipo)protein [Bacillus sp. S14(2024)]|uniref:DUF7018 domain-containing (lipo)protein n=1 Tax=Bacillus sp. S14(2024) TaxID=3162884 RepID=UPI003D20B37C
MGVNKLLCFAIPLMLLGGCATNSSANKPKDKIEAKEENKEKLTKEKYPIRMTALASELMQKISEITEMAMDKNKDEKTLAKEILKEESNLQKIIAKFHKIEPPKEFEESHKTILKAVDCYSKAYKIQADIVKSGSKDTSKASESMKLIKEGNEYWVEGFKPLQDAQLNQANSLSDKTGVKFDSPSTSKSDGTDIKISEEGKEWQGEWGSYVGSDFRKSLEFRGDHTYTAFDDTGKGSYEDNHMLGEWYYDADTKELSLSPTEFVRNGKKIDPKDMKVLVKYKVKSFDGNHFHIIDEKGTEIKAEKKK